MAKKKKGFEYESVLDSIYKTLTANQKPNGKLKPIKFDNKPSATNEMARAITEIAAAPEFYLSNSLYAGTTGPLEAMSLISVNLANADTYGNPAVELKIKVKDLPTLISDPDALVDKAMDALKQRAKKDSLVTIGRVLDTATTFFQAKKNKIDDPFAFALSAGTWVSPNLDRKVDEHVIGAAVYNAKGEFEKLSVKERDALVKDAWKAMDNGKMRSKYGAHWWALADKDSYAYKRLESTLGKEDPTTFSRVISEVKSAYSGSLSKSGIANTLHGDLLSSLTKRSNYYDPYGTDSEKGVLANLANRRFYSNQGNPDKGETASNISYSPGYYRESYAQKNEGRLALLAKEYEAERQKANPNTARITELLKEINDASRNTASARYHQSLQGFNNGGDMADVDAKSYGADLKAAKGNEGVKRKAKITNHLAMMERRYNELAANGVDVSEQIKRIKQIQGKIAASQSYLMGGTTAPTVGGLFAALGGRIGIQDGAEIMQQTNHEVADLALDFHIQQLKEKIREIQKETTDPNLLRIKLEPFEEQIRAVEHERKFFNPKKYQIKQWERTFARYNQMIGIVQSIKEGQFLPSILSGDFFKDPVFGTGKFADPDAGDALDIQLMTQKDGKYEKFTLAYYLREDTERAAWYRELTGVYHLLPQNIVKTLFYDGEGFKYLMDRRYNKFMFGDSKSFPGLKATILEEFRTNETFKNDFMALICKNLGIDPKDSGTIPSEVLVDFIESNPGMIMAEMKNLPDNLKFVKAFFEKNILNSSTKKIIEFYSKYSPDTIFQAVKKKFFKKFFQTEIINKTLQSVLTFGGRIGMNTVWGQTVTKFLAAELGFQQLLVKGIQLIAEYIGVGTGPVGWAVMIIITLFGPAIVEKLIKPIATLVMTMVSVILRGVIIGIALLIFGIIFVLGGGTIFTFSPTALISPLEASGNSQMPETNALYCAPADTPDINLGSANIKGSCPFKSSAIDCTQGSNPKTADYLVAQGIYCSHESPSLRHKAIDLATGAGIFYASSDGKVTRSEKAPADFCGGQGGGVVFFEGTVIDKKTNKEMKVSYNLYHVKPLVGVGTVKKGQPIAEMQVVGTDGYVSCSTGAHYHITISKPGGGFYEPESFFRSVCPDVLSVCGGIDCPNAVPFEQMEGNS